MSKQHVRSGKPPLCIQPVLEGFISSNPQDSMHAGEVQTLWGAWAVAISLEAVGRGI